MRKYSKTSPETSNILQRSYDLTMDLRRIYHEKLMWELGWSSATVYSRLREGNLSRAEKTMIRQIFVDLMKYKIDDVLKD